MLIKLFFVFSSSSLLSSKVSECSGSLGDWPFAKSMFSSSSSSIWKVAALAFASSWLSFASSACRN